MSELEVRGSFHK